MIRNRKADDGGFPVIPFNLLGIKVRGIFVPDGAGAGIAHVATPDFVTAVNEYSVDSPFSPFVRRKMETLTVQLPIADGDSVRLMPCLSEDAAMEVAMLFPNEIGDRVRQLARDAFVQLRRFNADKAKAAEHFAGEHIKEGGDPSRLRARLDTVINVNWMRGEVKATEDMAGCYVPGSDDAREPYWVLNNMINKASTGHETREIRAIKQVKDAPDGMTTVGLQNRAAGLAATAEVLKRNRDDHVAAADIGGARAVNRAMYADARKVCDLVDQFRKGLERIGISGI